MGHLESLREPGVTAFDARWREPATLNMFCMSLGQAQGRAAFEAASGPSWDAIDL